MPTHKAPSPEFDFDPVPAVADPAQLTMLREQWLQALCLTAGTSFRMETGEESVTLTVSLPVRHLECNPQAAMAVPLHVPKQEPAGTEEVWVRLKIPFALRKQFKAVARHLQIRPMEVLRMLIEDFARSGRMPSR